MSLWPPDQNKKTARRTWLRRAILTSVASLICALTLWTLQVKPQALPPEQSSAPHQTRVQFSYHPGQNSTFLFETTACMASYFYINGHLRWLTALPAPKTICHDSVEINLKSDLRPGENTIEIWHPKTSASVLFIGSSFFGYHTTSTILCLLLMVLIAILIGISVQAMGLSRDAVILILSGFIVCAVWLAIQPNTTYTNDSPSHIEYILTIAENWTQPFLYQGWESFQPPGYYLVAAAIKTLLSPATRMSPLTIIRVVSLLFFMVFLVFAVKTFDENILCHRLLKLVGLSTIVFWPVSILASSRINNDIALYAFWASGYYFLIRWFKNRSKKSLAISIILMSLGLLFKANSVVLGTIIAALMISRLNIFFRSEPSFENLKWALLVFMVCLGSYGLWSEHKQIDYKFKVPEQFLSEMNETRMTIHHFLRFDIVEFYSNAFINWPEPRPPLPFFNFFFHTALFGESSYHHAFLARIMNCLFILQFALFLAGGIALVIWDRKESQPYLISIIIPVLIVMTFMATRNWLVCQDFRFILPVIVPYAITYTKAAHWFRIKKWPFISNLMVIVAGLFSGCSVAFILAHALTLMF